MIHDRNIICVASSWYDHPTSKHHVMRLLAGQNHVLWINFHASRRPQLNRSDTKLAWRRLQRAWSGVRRVAPQLDVLSPLLIPMPESRLARVLNSRILASYIRRHLRGLPRRPTQLWLFTPDVPELLEQMRFERVVYYCVDDFAAFSGYNTPLIEALEERTLAASDVVIATSTRLFEERGRRHNNVHLVPHGVDYEHFAAAATLPASAIPADLQGLSHPVFGYMGLVTDYVDLELIAQAARRHPQWSFVLLGDVRCNTSAVAGLSNVRILGGRPYAELPRYCRGFDVGLIPFHMNRLVRAVNPIKLREYLAAGLPVVSAPLYEVVGYAPAVLMAETLAEFEAACEAALVLARRQGRAGIQGLVREEGWRTRVEQLSQIVSGEAVPAAAADVSRACATAMR